MEFVQPSPPAPTETILLVDDEAGIRTLFARSLRNAGYSVIAARTGTDAMDALSSHSVPVDLVISDVIMPKGSGRDLLSALRRRYPWIPVLLISGYPDGQVVASDLLDAQTEFLAKPFGPETLLAHVRALLDSAR